ncbi:MAG: M23 family metallopeptidase [Proteobacteria bacterium]|nr:M23 family metallopeptidase [Pseudomonadota bacterium]
MTKKTMMSKIRSISLDRTHLLLIALTFGSLYLNASLYIYNYNLQREIEELSDNSEQAGEAPEAVITPSPTGQEVAAPAKQEMVTLTVRQGDTLYQIFNDAGIAPADANAILAAINAVHKASQLQVGQKVVIDFRDATDIPAPDGNGHHAPSVEGVVAPSTEEAALSQYYSRVKKINILSDEEDIAITYNDAKAEYTAHLITIPIHEHFDVTSGVINESLYGDAINAGVSPNVILDLINKFSYDVDFQRDIKVNDAFSVYYNYYINDSGKKVRDGNIVYGALTLSGKKLEIFRYKNGDVVDYFDRSGNSIRKTLLKTPINGAKITSGFGNRIHPIYGFSKMHKGLDYGAPRGTPVLAAGDGVIDFVKYTKNGYGKHIKLRHTHKYSTLYAHLDRFAKGMKKGSRVSQGDVIGYVGATGLATGAHLHYEVHANGIQVNPAKTSFAKYPALQGNNLQKFKAWVQEVDHKVEEAAEKSKNGQAPAPQVTSTPSSAVTAPDKKQ